MRKQSPTSIVLPEDRRNRSIRMAWLAALSSTLVSIFMFGMLYVGEAFGWTWILYLFVACALVCTISWAYLASLLGWFM